MDRTKNGFLLKNGKKICYNPWTHFEVNNPDGSVMMCPDINMILGNINEQSIEEIWNGKKYQELRKMMYEEGAEKVCSSNCFFLQGMENYELLSWYSTIPTDSPVFINANINEEEFRTGKIILQSKPRYLRFAISYKCNYNCYHCYQKDDRKNNIKLPVSFLDDIKRLAEYCQFLVFFGGEPTILPEFLELLQLADKNPYMRFSMITNASLIHKYIDEISKVRWGYIYVSLDAATPAIYKELRNANNWEQVNKNLLLLSDLKKARNCDLIFGMTVNRKNCGEIYDFVRLSNRLGATPNISLVDNPDGFSFHKKYLWFSSQERKAALAQLERILHEFPITYASAGLDILRKNFERSSLSFNAAHLKRMIKTMLPPSIKDIIKQSLMMPK